MFTFVCVITYVCVEKLKKNNSIDMYMYEESEQKFLLQFSMSSCVDSKIKSFPCEIFHSQFFFSNLLCKHTHKHTRSLSRLEQDRERERGRKKGTENERQR